MICHDDDSPILDEIDTAPEDTERRLIYADWLEERGDRRCEFVRLEIEVEASVAGNDRKRLGELVTRLRDAGAGLDRCWKRRLLKSRTTEILVAIDSLVGNRSKR